MAIQGNGQVGDDQIDQSAKVSNCAERISDEIILPSEVISEAMGAEASSVMTRPNISREILVQYYGDNDLTFHRSSRDPILSGNFFNNIKNAKMLC